MDWSWSEHAVCVIDETGGAIARFTVRHTAAGLSRLVSVLQGHRVTGGTDSAGAGAAAPPRPPAGAALKWHAVRWEFYLVPSCR